MSEFILVGEGISFGDIQVRLAKNDLEIRQAQSIRYHIFYEEFCAKPAEKVLEAKLDFDHFDDYTDHLVVIDKSIADPHKAVVGTYRLLREDQALRAGRFYTSDEFDISKLTDNYSGLLEMGRSCVLPDYRTKAVLQLLWQGIAEYVAHHNIKFLFGCASFHGTNPQDHAEALSFLYHNHMAPEDFRPIALPDVYTNMNWMGADQINPKNVLRNLPPLIKGYLRIGGMVGDGAFIDHQFDTTDVCVVLNTSMLTDSYQKHYERKTGHDFGTENGTS
jgi:putative hemolysin